MHVSALPRRWRLRDLVFLSLVFAAPAQGADLWLDPLRWRSEEGAGRIGIRARLGDAQRSRVLVRGEHELWVKSPRGWSEVEGEAGDDPIGLARLQGPGAHLLAYRGKAGFGRLGSAGWLRLFRESGRDPVDAPVEVSGIRYQRSAKSLILGGAPTGKPWERALGLDLELTPLRAPHELGESARGLSPLGFRLAWGGRPQVGVELRAWPLAGEAGAPLVAVTDAKGEASLQLTRRGPWVVCATALRPGDLTRWEAAFTSFSFSADPAPPAPGPAALAKALRAAQREGALQPLLGAHHFTFTRRHFEGGKEVSADEMIMTYTLSLSGEPGPQQVLRVAVDVSPRGTPHGIEFVYAVSLEDGRLRSLTNGEGSFVPSGGQLKTARGPARVDPALLLPKVVGVFLVPQLARAVPDALPGSLRMIDLTPFATLSRPLLLRPARPGEADFAPAYETWVTEEGRPQPTTRVRAARSGAFKGKLVEIRTVSALGPGGEVVSINDCQRVSPAAFAARWREWFGERK